MHKCRAYESLRVKMKSSYDAIKDETKNNNF